MYPEFHHFILSNIGGRTDSFFNTFFAEFLASFIVLIIGSIFIPKYLDWRKKPHLIIFNALTRNKIFHLTKSQDGFLESTLDLTIKNKGLTTQREWFWHLIVPPELQSQIRSLDALITCQSEDLFSAGRKWKHYLGSSQPKEVIYIGRNLRFNYELKIKTLKREQSDYKIYYYFSTEFGTWPKNAEKIESVIENPSVLFSPKYLGNIELKPFV